MAKHLFLMLDDKHRKDHKWLPGKPIGIGRLLSAEDIALSNLRVQLANEILKLIPEGADCIDRKTILTVNGAKFFDWAGFASKKSWIENARDQAKKFNKNVVLGV